MPPGSRLMLFDLYHGGHHGQYLRALVSYWARHALPGRLDVVVSREFGARHPDVFDAARGHPSVAFHPTAVPVELKEKAGRRAVLENDRRIGRLLRTAILQHRPDHAVLMYFDHLQFSLATGLRFPCPVKLSGIYFRPSFYYRRAGAGRGAARAVLDNVPKLTLLRLALRNPHVRTLFSLDPYAVGPVERLSTSARVLHLPEPFEAGLPPTETAAETHRRLGVEPGRRMLLLFGALDPRKGVHQLLEALGALPDALARRACLVMAGEISGRRQEIAAAVTELRSRGHIQIVHRDGFVSDPAEIQSLFRAASLVLMPYQHHVGSSNVLVRAAAAAVPVLGPDYGMLGALIRDRRLGLSVDTTQSAALTHGLAQFLETASPFPFDALAASAFASANSEEAMASTLFRHVLAAA